MLATIIAGFSVDAFATMASSSLLATIALMYFRLQACLARVVRGVIFLSSLFSLLTLVWLLL
jgi:hypothetical protein